MPFGGPDSERALILLRRRDAEVASKLLIEALFAVKICTDSLQLLSEIEVGTGLVVLSEEQTMPDTGIERFGEWIKAQPPWSDLPIILLIGRADAPSRNRSA